MKQYLVCLWLLFLTSQAFTQSTLNRDNQKPLKIDDQVPEILLTLLQDGKTSAVPLSSFRGKLVIIDFWTSYCPICLRSFDHMEELQATFKDSIVILTANIFESQEKIGLRMQLPRLKDIRLSLLPEIINTEDLAILFPHLSVPYHVWIDQKGFVKLLGSGNNTHVQKIDDFLSGKPITFIPGELNACAYDTKTTLFINIDGKNGGKDAYYSHFTTFQRKYGMGLGSVIDYRDSASQTIRSSFINMELITLLQHCLKGQSDPIWGKILISPSPLRALEGFTLQVKDSLPYTALCLSGKRFITDDDIAASEYCYEQVAPLSMSDSLRLSYMFNDLRKEIRERFDAEVTMQTINLPAYSIIRKSPLKLPRSPLAARRSIKKTENKGTNQFINQSLQTAIVTSMGYFFKQLNQYVVDLTGYTYDIDIELPIEKNIKSIEDVRHALSPYDMDVQWTTVKVRSIVIKDRH